MLAEKLREACQTGDLFTVQEVVAQGAIDLNERDSYGQTVLQCACRCGHWYIVRTLIGAGVGVATQDDEKWTPLMTACEHGHFAIVKSLVEDTGGKVIPTVDFQNVFGYTALALAARQRTEHLDIIRYLIRECGASANIADDRGYTPLMRACERNNFGAIRCLVEEGGADVEARNKRGKSALMATCFDGDLQTVRLLVEKYGADAHSKTIDGWTTLMYACSLIRTNLDVVKYLIRTCNVDVNVRNCNGEMAIHFASTPTIEKYLLENVGPARNATRLWVGA